MSKLTGEVSWQHGVREKEGKIAASLFVCT